MIGRGKMGRIALLGLILVLLAACATPQGIKQVSRQQVDLLKEFHKALEEVRTKLLVFYDEEIEEFRRELLRSRMAAEEARISERVYETIHAISPQLTKEEREKKVMEIVGVASNYLANLPKNYFTDDYCKQWSKLQEDLFGETGTECDSSHVRQYKKLSEGRKEIAERFNGVVMAIGKTRDAHDLVNEFLQIEFRLTREQVDETKRVMEGVNKIVEDTKKGYIQFRKKEGGS
jgi:hypothetical protein